MALIPNEYIVHEDYTEIIIKSPKYGVFNAYVDIDDFDKCKKLNWCIMVTYHLDADLYYVRATVKGKAILLHRYVTGITERKTIVDHIDGNPLNNKKSNLRIGDMRQNNMNRKHENENTVSGYRGVYYADKLKTPKWIAHIKVNGKRKHLGQFDVFEEALKARKEAEEKYFGEFARAN